MKFVTTKEFHDKFAYLQKELNGEKSFVITSHGIPRMLVLPINEEELEEMWLQHPKIKKRIQASIKDLSQGKGIGHEEVKKQLFGKS